VRAGRFVWIEYASVEVEVDVLAVGREGMAEIETRPSIEAVPTKPVTRTTSCMDAECGLVDLSLEPSSVNRCNIPLCVPIACTTPY
jgi:hypothetical protein